MLDILCKLFESLNENNIKYSVHLRPREYMDKCFSEESDLDILVDSLDANEVENTYIKLGFKRTYDTSGMSYNGVEDWFAFDSASGMIVHLHTHYRVIYGPRFNKGAEFKWAKIILNNSDFYSKEFPSIRVGCPELETILIVVKFFFSLSIFQKIKARLSGVSLNKKEITILDYLSNGFDETIFGNIINEMFSGCDSHLMKSMKEIISAKAISANSFTIISKTIHNNLKERGLSYNKIHLVNFTRSICYYISRLSRGIVKSKFHLDKKSLHTEGRIITFIGCDGSGKSTVSRIMYDWLSWKFNTGTTYLGSGDGYKSIISILRNFGSSVISRSRKHNKENESSKVETQKSQKSVKDKIKGTKLFKYINCRDYLNLSHSVKMKLRRISRFRTKGGVVILDRYPQIQFDGIFDGPKIESNYIKASKKERKNLSEAVLTQPDIVIKLIISPECSLRRKPGDPRELIEEKVRITNDLKFPDSRVYEVNAEQNFEEELLEIKRIIWDNL